MSPIEPLRPVGSGGEAGLAPVSQEKALPSKLLARTLGYMSIALLVTGVTAFLFAFLMASLFGEEGGYLSDTGSLVMLVILVIALVAGMIVAFVFSKNAVTKANPPWVSYILYSIIEGVMFGSFIVIPGVSFALIGEAFLITFLVFGACFLVGYFAKGELKILSFLAMAIGFGILACSLLFLPMYFFGGMQAVVLMDFGISVAFVVMVALLVAVDARRLKKIALTSANNKNIALMCAMNFYCDFMMILIRILYLLLLTRRSN